jgi:hypothetical protein
MIISIHLTGRPRYFRPKNRFLWHSSFVVVLLAHCHCNTRVLCRKRRGIAWHACSLLPEAAWAQHVQNTILGVGKMVAWCAFVLPLAVRRRAVRAPAVFAPRVWVCREVLTRGQWRGCTYCLHLNEQTGAVFTLPSIPASIPKPKPMIAKTRSLPAETRCNGAE